MNSTFGFAIVGALARLLRPLGLGPLAGADPELPAPEPELPAHFEPGTMWAVEQGLYAVRAVLADGEIDKIADAVIARLETHEHVQYGGFGVWHRHTATGDHPIAWADAHPGQDPDRQ